MREPRHRKKTERGLGDPDEVVDATPPPPPSSRQGVSLSPPRGRYSMRPSRKDTLDFPQTPAPSTTDPSELQGIPRSRVPTTRMQTCVEDAGLVAAALASRTPDTIILRRLPTPRPIDLAPLSSQHAFVLSLVDGPTPISTLFDTTGLDREAVVRSIDRLLGLGLLELDG